MPRAAGRNLTGREGARGLGQDRRECATVVVRRGVLPAEPTAKPKARRAEPLFEGVAGIERDWVRELLDGPAFAEQMRIAGGRLDGARAEQALRALVAHNRVLMKPALAQRVDLPQFRIDGFLSNLQRVLNVDGYLVVSVDDSDTVRLDIDLLKKQFGLE
jgi:hypothetical protein